MTPRIRVLHVDDRPEFAETTAAFLERGDDQFAVTVAGGADEALDLLADGEFDCVVSDYDMPGMDGIEFLAAVREEHPDLPFILYTGKGSEAIASEAIAAGVTDYLQKEGGPDQYTVLANRIKNAVDQVRSRNELAATEERLSLFVEQSPLGVIEWCDEFEIVQVNPAAEEILGYAEEDLVGQSWEAIVPDSSAGTVGETVSELLDADGGYHSVNENVRKDGTRIVCEWYNHVVTDSTGETVAIYSQFQDITDRTERKDRLQTSTARLEALFEDSPNMINVHDDAGTITDPNRRLCEETGYDADELTGMKVWEIDQTMEPGDARALWAGMEVGDRRELETRFRRRDGSTFPVEVHVRRLDLIGEDRFVVISRNISDLKERERTLRQLQRRTEELVRTSTRERIADIAVDTARDVLGLRLSSVHFVDADGTTLKPVAATDEVHDYWDPLPTYDRADPDRSVDTFNWDVFEGGETVVIEDIHEQEGITAGETPTRSGVVQPLGDHGVFIASSLETRAFDDADVAFIRILATTVTAALDRAEREATLRERKRRLEAETERLEEFAGIVSHDLRNPLSVAEGRLDLARNECDSDHLDAVESAHDRMRALIEDVLTLAREGAPIKGMEPVALADAVGECWRTTETGEAALVVDVEHTIRADASRLRQLLENLIRNAVEHGPPDVTVRIGPLDDADGFFVADDGPGIPADDRETVFENGYSTLADGTGLGLGIVREIAGAHGWEVTAAESENGGARFEVTGVEFVE